MRFEKIPLSASDPSVYLDAYIADEVRGLKRHAILVIPGGGYSGVCADREGEPIAQAFMPYGYQAFVLHYTVGRKRPFPCQLNEAVQAITHIKDHAEEYGIDPRCVFVVGFSAGGHLAATTGVLWKHPSIPVQKGRPSDYHKPTGVMLIYPVTTADSHAASFHNLLCTDTPDAQKLQQVSIERHVDSDSVPAFMMHTADDNVVDVRGTLALARAYADAGVPFELHVYPHGPHGMALANRITDLGNPVLDNPAIASWVENAAMWADELCKSLK